MCCYNACRHKRCVNRSRSMRLHSHALATHCCNQCTAFPDTAVLRCGHIKQTHGGTHQPKHPHTVAAHSHRQGTMNCLTTPNLRRDPTSTSCPCNQAATEQWVSLAHLAATRCNVWCETLSISSAVPARQALWRRFPELTAPAPRGTTWTSSWSTKCDSKYFVLGYRRTRHKKRRCCCMKLNPRRSTSARLSYFQSRATVPSHT